MSEAIYNRIAMLRAERGISRRELADALGVHYQTVGYLERGPRPGPRQLETARSRGHRSAVAGLPSGSAGQAHASARLIIVPNWSLGARSNNQFGTMIKT